MSNKRFSLNNPYEGHTPSVFSHTLGVRWGGGRPMGTSLRCSCGWTPYTTTHTNPDGTTETRPNPRLTNEAPPSRGGRAIANARYQQHILEDVLGTTVTELPVEQASLDYGR